MILDLLLSIPRAAIGSLLSLFEGLHPFYSLAPLGVLTGIGLLWGFRRLSDQCAIRQTKQRLRAHLYELRLFVDEPKLIWRAQCALLKCNVRYVGLMALPIAILSLPMLVLFVHLDAFYGLKPLTVGSGAMVTARLTRPVTAGDPKLELPDGMVAETPPVRIPAESEVSWRVRPIRPVSGLLRVTIDGETGEKTISSTTGPEYLSRRRVASTRDLFWNSSEEQLDSRSIAWIEVAYPETRVEFLGIRLHWAIWMLIVSMLAALLLRKRMKVTL